MWNPYAISGQGKDDSGEDECHNGRLWAELGWARPTTAGHNLGMQLRCINYGEQSGILGKNSGNPVSGGIR